MPRRTTLVTLRSTARLHAAIIWLLANAARFVAFRGVQRLSWTLATVFKGDNRVLVQVDPQTRLVVPLWDGYWTKLLSPHYVYEPEIAGVLQRHLDRRSYFLDCGANIGYWSLLARNRARRVIALEANPVTFARLEENVFVNSAGITTLNLALWDCDGEELTIECESRQHAGASVARSDPGQAPKCETVLSTTLRTLIKDYCPDAGAKIVIKLDVEGAEIQAIQGAGDLLKERDVLIAYEDHGNDPDCRVSRYLQSIGLVTLDPVTETKLTIEEIAGRKIKAWKGYNFLARFPS